MRRRGRLLVLPLFLSACARPPGALRGSFAPLTVRDAQARAAAGERVRWGGSIVSTRPGKDATCFEIVSKPLDRQARPIDGDETLGRFVACAPGFYDPAIYLQGRDVTVTGTLAEPMTRQVGDYEYRFPIVKADTVYLWPKPRERAVYYDPWLDPVWAPFPTGVGGSAASSRCRSSCGARRPPIHAGEAHPKRPRRGFSRSPNEAIDDISPWTSLVLRLGLSARSGRRPA